MAVVTWQVLVFVFVSSFHRYYPRRMELTSHRLLFLYNDCLFLQNLLPERHQLTLLNLLWSESFGLHRF